MKNTCGKTLGLITLMILALLLCPMALAEGSGSASDPIVLSLDTQYSIPESSDGSNIYYSFTPEEDGDYVFKSFGPDDWDPMCDLYPHNNANDYWDESLDHHDDIDGDDYNFALSHALEANIQYIYKMSYRSDPSAANYVMIQPDTTLRLSAETEDGEEESNSYVPEGENHTLKVVVKTNNPDADLTYTWYRNDLYAYFREEKPGQHIDGANSDTLEFNDFNVDMRGAYTCLVIDRNSGLTDYVTFQVDIKAEMDEALKTLQLNVPVPVTGNSGSSVEFTFTPPKDGRYVIESSDGQDFGLSCELLDSEGNHLADSDDIDDGYYDADTGRYEGYDYNFTLSYELKANEEYTYSVWLNRTSLGNFTVMVTPDTKTLIVEADGSTYFTKKPGETATLKVNATTYNLDASLTYTWYKTELFSRYNPKKAGDPIEGANSDTLDVIVNEDTFGVYTCVVTDAMVNKTMWVSFNVRLNQKTPSTVALQLNKHEYITGHSGDIISFTFTPQESGDYVFLSSDYESFHLSSVLYQVLDGDPEELESSSINYDDEEMTQHMELSYELEEGESYVYKMSVSCYDEEEFVQSFYVMLRQQYQFEVHAEGYESDRYVPIDDPVDLKVEVETDNPTPALTYKWYKAPIDAEIEDEEEGLGELIDGANGDTYSIEAVNKDTSGMYICVVTDTNGGSSGRTAFWVYPDSGLKLLIDEDSTHLTVKPDEDVKLKVLAECNEGEPLTYKWHTYGWDPDEGDEVIVNLPGNGDTYTISAPADNGEYWCTVSDQYGRSMNEWFYVRVDNEFTASADCETDIVVNPGDGLTLKVKAEAYLDDDITYQWMQKPVPSGDDDEDYYDEDEYVDIDDETGTELLLNDIQASTSYLCKVKDGYSGDEVEIAFYITVDGGLQVTPVGDTVLKVAPDTEVTLAVEATCTGGTPQYAWYRYDDYDENWVNYDADYNDFEITDSSYTFNATMDGRYKCEVSDAYGNTESVVFTVTVDTGFSVNMDESYDLTANYDDTVDVTIDASVNEGCELFYDWQRYETWYDEDDDWDYSGWRSFDIEPVDGSTFTLGPVTEFMKLRVDVHDNYGHSQVIYFNIGIENHLTAKAKDDIDTFTIKRGEGLTLEVEASCDAGSLTYSWYKPEDVDEDEFNELGDETRFIIDEDIIYDSTVYCCQVTDGFGTPVTVEFHINVVNDFTASRVGDMIRYVKSGEKATLEAEVQADELDDLILTWSTDQDESDTAQGITTFQTKALTKTSIYRFTASNDYSSTDPVYYICVVDGDELVLNEMTADSCVNENTRVFPYVPNRTGAYILTCSAKASCRIRVYDSALEEIAYGTAYNQANLFFDMQAGEHYFIEVASESNRTTPFTVKLAANVPAEIRTMTLMLSQQEDLPVELPVGGKIEEIVPAEGSADVAEISEDNALTLNGTGTAVIEVIYDSGKVRYEITVVNTDGILKLPAGLKAIGPKAFAGNSSIKVVRLNDKLNSIGKDAFVNTGLIQIILNSANPNLIADMIQDGMSPTIICAKGSAAEQYAIRKGLPYAYLK